MPHPLIQITNLSAGYDGKTVLSHVNLTVYERDFLGVIGPNGGGKTTLVKNILGLQKPLQGQIRFYKNGKEVPEITMGYLPQYHSIDQKFPISVYEVVLSGLSKQKSLLHSYSNEHHEQVKRITILPEPLSMERGELTNTLKVRRPVLNELYKEEIDKMYEEQ